MPSSLRTSNLFTPHLFLLLLVTPLTLGASFKRSTTTTVEEKEAKNDNDDDDNSNAFIEREKKNFFLVGGDDRKAAPVRTLFRTHRSSSAEELDPALQSFSTVELNYLMSLLSRIQNNPGVKLSPDEERLVNSLMGAYTPQKK